MKQPIYHLLTPQMTSLCGVDLFVTDDGIYLTQQVFGLTMPVLLLACEIRGLSCWL